MSDRKEFRDLVSPEEARETIRSLDLDPGVESVPIEEARGRVLAERIDATIDVPGFDRATLDGYALRAADTVGADEADPALLDLVGTVHAGQRADVPIDDGEAVEISTGAVMPPDADAMVPVERTDRPEEGTVAVRTALAPGDNVMRAGADVAAGERTLGPGTRLTPREVGLLSALGVSDVPVLARPRVGIVSTGDELVRPGGHLDHRSGQIHDVNTYATASAVEDAGGEAVTYPHVGDDMDALEATLTRAAAECDLVLSSGSTSASAVDVIYRVIEEQGELLLHGVAVKPGKPMLVGRLSISDDPDDRRPSSGESAYVGLPGYPVSALTIFRAFVAPAIRAAAGLPEPRTGRVDGEMAVEERYEEGRRRLLPVGIVEEGDRTLVYPVDKGSGATTSLVEADGIVTVPAEVSYLAAGEAVTVDLFSSDVRPPTVLGMGEDDPAWSALLDRLDRPRYLAVGTREGVRRLRNGVPDVAVAAGPIRRTVDAEDLGGWTREWGLIVSAGNPQDVTGLAALVDRDLRLINRETDSGLRTDLEDAIDDLADERGVDRHDLVGSIDGWSLAARAHESPARAVIAGDADAGLGLRATADRLGLGFVSLGEQTVRVLANPDRVEKSGVRELGERLSNEVDAVIDRLDGYGRIDR